MKHNAEIDYQKYLSLNDRPTALCCVNDITADAFIEAVKKTGEQLPQGSVVTGFDNLPLSRELNFTTVSQNFAMMGKEGLRVLDAMITGKQTGKIKLYPNNLHLIIFYDILKAL
jgi:LacI family transcriptional regulator/LacI family purine nucleotide synthesis repressor